MSKDGRPRKNGYGSKRRVTKAEKFKEKVEKMNAEARAKKQKKRTVSDESGKATNLEQVKTVDRVKNGDQEEEIPTMAVGQIWSLKSHPTLFVKGECEISCHLPFAHKVMIVSCDASAGIRHETGLVRVVKVLPLIPITELSGDDELTLLDEQLEKPFKSELAIQIWNPQLVFFHNFNIIVGQVKHGSALFQFLSGTFEYPSQEQQRVVEAMSKGMFSLLSTEDQCRIKHYRSMKYIRHPYNSLDRMSVNSFVRKITRSNRV